jgi:hypothetical protein
MPSKQSKRHLRSVKIVSPLQHCTGCVVSANQRLQPPTQSVIAAIIGRHGGSVPRPSRSCEPIWLSSVYGWAGLARKTRKSRPLLPCWSGAEGEGILLIFDNVSRANAVMPYLPHTGATKVLITSNSHAWRGIAEPVKIREWPTDVGAEYLIARTGRTDERTAAEALSARHRGGRQALRWR